MNRKALYLYIHSHDVGVLSTVSASGAPEAALMQFGDTKRFELIFDTLSTTRKYKNLQQNPRVAFTIGRNDGTTVQYEGIASELSGGELTKYKKIMFAKNSEFQKWETLPNMTYFKVTPKWIRYACMDHPPWEITF